MKKSCVIYDSWADQILNLPNEIAGEYIKAILQYAIYGEEYGSENTFLKAMLIPVKKKLDEDSKKYQAQVDRMNKNRDGGQKSNRSQTEVRQTSRRNHTEVASDTVTVTVTDTVKKNKKKPTFHNFPEREYDYAKLTAGGNDV